MNTRHVVLDVETTGFSPLRGDRIIEIGIVELANYQPTGKEFQQCFDPGQKLSSRITQITGIRDHDLAGKPKFGDPKYVRELVDFIGRSDIIAHNAGFDRRFLNAELARVGAKEFPEKRWIDTLELARREIGRWVGEPGGPDSLKLDALCQHFRISLKGREKYHRALVDCYLTVQVFAKLRKIKRLREVSDRL